jgi:hypothetical protein
MTGDDGNCLLDDIIWNDTTLPWMDLTGDASVDVLDASMFAASQASGLAWTDLSGDGVIDFDDYLMYQDNLLDLSSQQLCQGWAYPISDAVPSSPPVQVVPLTVESLAEQLTNVEPESSEDAEDLIADWHDDVINAGGG